MRDKHHIYVTTFLQLWYWNETTSWDLVLTKKLPAASAEASVEDSVEVQQQDGGLLLLDHLNLLHCRVWYHWISSTTGCHIRPMQTFSLLSFILESGWPCIHLDWGSKYDLRSRQKNHPVKTGNDYIIAPKYDWTTPGPGDGKIMERALFQGRCKYGNGNSKARIMERECFECCVKERCMVKFVSLRNRRKWIYCEPGCKGFCNA